jgi:single-stranded-DNA-specific exonuclease
MHSTKAPISPSPDELPGKAIWELRPAHGDFLSLAQELRVHPVTARIMVSRGFGTPELAAGFLNPGWDNLLNPRDLPDFERATIRTARAIKQRERILVFGDYDVDGIAATAMLLHAIRICGGNVGWDIPHRLLDGYGLKDQHVDAALKKGATLIITADCGIQSLVTIQRANKCGIDVIITDHHIPDSELPPALAIINPNRTDSAYANRHLCGAGLAFKFAAGLLSRMQIPERKGRELLASFLKLAAIATIADVMPLVGENRAMVRLGLRGLAEVKSQGLRLLLEAARIPAGRAPTAREIAFQLAPRINAAGRLEDAALIMDLLTTRDPAAAASLVKALEQINFRRKEEQVRVLDEIGRAVCPSGAVLVFSGRGWHRGVLGIVAARLVDQFHRPVIALSEEDNLAQGSGRSIPGIDLHALLERVRNLLEAFGGHSQAAGLSLQTSRIDAFRRAICAACPAVPVQKTLQVDANLRLAEAARVWPELAKLEPFGTGNPIPVFATRVQVEAAPVSITPWVWRMRVRQSGRLYEVRNFGSNDCGIELEPGKRIDMAYSLQPDSWKREGFVVALEAVRPTV